MESSKCVSDGSDGAIAISDSAGQVWFCFRSILEWCFSQVE